MQTKCRARYPWSWQRYQCCSYRPHRSPMHFWNHPNRVWASSLPSGFEVLNVKKPQPAFVHTRAPTPFKKGDWIWYQEGGAFFTLPEEAIPQKKEPQKRVLLGLIQASSSSMQGKSQAISQGYSLVAYWISIFLTSYRNRTRTYKNFYRWLCPWTHRRKTEHSHLLEYISTIVWPHTFHTLLYQFTVKFFGRLNDKMILMIESSYPERWMTPSPIQIKPPWPWTVVRDFFSWNGLSFMLGWVNRPVHFLESISFSYRLNPLGTKILTMTRQKSTLFYTW